MAESSSPAFNPPMGAPKPTDPMVEKVAMDRTDWGFRKGQAPAFQNGLPPISHVSNGR
jgi:hypothetical protein